MSWSTSIISLNLYVGFSNFNPVLFSSKFIFLFNKKPAQQTQYVLNRYDIFNVTKRVLKTRLQEFFQRGLQIVFKTSSTHRPQDECLLDEYFDFKMS